MNQSETQRLYETERQLPNRNYAKDHSLEEWSQREGHLERIDTNPAIMSKRHSCQVCKSPEYQRAIAIIQRSGIDPDKWGFLLHDIAQALRGAK